jgi:glycosyltransferase involved in cell wall biosynthesis
MNSPAPTPPIPKVSIVTISFNQAEFLEAAILSVISQSYPNIEYILIDAGSTDGSRDIIERYRHQIARVVFEGDNGPADGLNKGFRIATGEIFGFLNSDDVLLPNALASACSYLAAHPEVDIVSGHAYITDVQGQLVRKSHSDRFDRIATAYGSAVLMQQSTFFRREIFSETAGFNVANRVAWDGELYIAMSEAGARFATVNEFWSEFRLHNQSITSSMRLDQLFRQYRQEIFKRIMGRDFALYDYVPFLYYRIRKHLANPSGLIERLRFGPIYGRDKPINTAPTSSIRFSVSKGFRQFKKSPLVQQILSNQIAPFARWAAFQVLHKSAMLRARAPRFFDASKTRRTAYIIGCGRSGTTILGEVLELHADVRYFFEPVYLWREVLPATDVTQFFGSNSAHAMLRAEDVTEATREHFARLTAPGLLEQTQLLLEKTPHNAWRIGFLEQLSPGCKYVHIARDGIEVANSIRALADANQHRVAFMPRHNTWWGVDNAKWHILVKDCTACGYFADELQMLQDNFQRGALEWVVSLLKIAKWRDRLGERLLEISLPQLKSNPMDTLQKVCKFLDLPVYEPWLSKSVRCIGGERAELLPTLMLPPRLCAAFNSLQEEFGFEGRAQVLRASASARVVAT